MNYICPNDHVTDKPTVERNLLTRDPYPIYDPYMCCPYCGEYPIKPISQKREAQSRRFPEPHRLRGG